MSEVDFVKVQSTDVGSTGSVVTLQVLGFGSTNNDSQAETVPAIESVQPIGFATRPSPTVNTEALVVRRGDEVIALVVFDKGQQNGSAPALADIEQGEARVYGPSAPSAQIRIRANGDITIIPKSGQVVSIGDVPGSTQFVMNGSDLRTYLSSLETRINELRSDMSTIATHSHAGVTVGAGTSGTSPALSAIPTGTAAPDPPALSTKVKTI